MHEGYIKMKNHRLYLKLGSLDYKTNNNLEKTYPLYAQYGKVFSLSVEKIQMDRS